MRSASAVQKAAQALVQLYLLKAVPSLFAVLLLKLIESDFK